MVLVITCLLLLLLALTNCAIAAAVTTQAPAKQLAPQLQQQQQVPTERKHRQQKASTTAGMWKAQVPIPELPGYSFSSARDTFDLCRVSSRLTHARTLQDLLAIFQLPMELLENDYITLKQATKLLHEVQPSFEVLHQPMLFKEADAGSCRHSSKSSGSLPSLVHLTVQDKNMLKPHQVVSMASWAFHNPHHKLLLFDDTDVRNFMSTYYSDLLPLFDGLGSQVERTDLWRYLVLCKLGGVYADSDVVAARPVANWVQDAGLLVGVENIMGTAEDAKQRGYASHVQMVQWAIASHKGHPVVCRMVQYVAKRVQEEAAGRLSHPDRDQAILERTGPGIWSSSVHDYIKEAGNVSVEHLVAGGRVGDVRVLPQPVFGCSTATYNPKEDPLPYVYHMFTGSWRSSNTPVFITMIRKVHSQMQDQESLSVAEKEKILAAAKAAALEAAGFARSHQAATYSNVIVAAAAGAVPSQGQQSSSSRTGLHKQLSGAREQTLQQRQQQQQQQLGHAVGGTYVASTAGNMLPAAARADNASKLRLSSLMLVHGLLHKKNVAAVGGSHPVDLGLPTKARSVPAMSLLVLVLAICALYKRHGSRLLAGVVQAYGIASATGPHERRGSRNTAGSTSGHTPRFLGPFSSKPGSRGLLSSTVISELPFTALSTATPARVLAESSCL